MALSYVTVTGTFTDGSGAPLTGAPVFTPSAAVLASGIPVVTPQSPVQAEISGGQLLSRTGGPLQLLATGQGGTAVEGLSGFWFWSVSGLPGGMGDFSFFLPASPSEVDISALINSPASGGGGSGTVTSVAVESANGFAGTVADDTADAQITLSTTVTGLLKGNGTAVSAAVAGTDYDAAGAAGTAQSNAETFATAAVAAETGRAETAEALLVPLSDLPLSVAHGGSGQSSLTAYELLAAGTTSTGALQQIGLGSSGQVLTSNGAGALPSMQAAGGGGVSQVTFTYGSTGAVPSSGTYTAGAVTVDQNGILRVCTASGSPGTWARVGAQPWQFWVDDYGTKGDVTQALVSVTEGSAVITTTPIAAPAAPTVANAGTGGTVLAGTYGAKATYVNAYGETVASSSASTTTSGSTSTVTVTPTVALAGNATGVNVYVTQAGGSTYTLQNSTPLALGQALVLTAPPTSSGAQPPGTNGTAAQVFTSTGVDGGKNFMVCGAGGAIPGGPWIGTISTVQSSTQCTAAATSPTSGNFTSCAMVFSSDDRVAIDNCMTAAGTYALAGDYLCQVLFSAKGYGLGANVFQEAAGTSASGLSWNTQLRIPVPGNSGDTRKLTVVLTGAGDTSYEQFWMSQYPNLGGSHLVSYSVGPDSNPSATYGWQSIAGVPTGGAPSSGSNFFFPLRVGISGLQAWQPGWSNTIGFDLQWAGGCRVAAAGSFAYAPATNDGGGVNPYSAWNAAGFWQSNKIGAGIRLPAYLNNQDTLVESFAAGGLPYAVVTGSDGPVMGNIRAVSCGSAVHLAGTSGNAHELVITRLYWENCNTGVDASALSGLILPVNITMDSEAFTFTGYDVSDPGDVLAGIIHWADTQRNPAVPLVNGATGVKIINDMLYAGHWSTSQVGTAPAAAAVPGSTSPVTAADLPWRDASIVVHTGSGVTVSAISIGGTSTGLTMAASSSLALPVAPSGKAPALTYSGGTPTWDWWLA